MAAPPQTIAVIGAGHVGVPHAVTIANKCPKVKIIVCDDDKRKVASWCSSLLPFYEPGLQEGLEEVRGSNLTFESDMTKAIANADMILVSVSTPLKDDGFGAHYAPDLQHWEKMARLIAAATTTPKVIVERSTVPIRTADLMSKVLSANSGGQKWTVLSNPEFAREGNAMVDHASPERVMIGALENDEAKAAAESLRALYAEWVPMQKIIISGLWSAELSKLTANAFLAQRISSINAISALCENTGADVSEVAYAIGYDSRIGRKHLSASVGFGGACYETHLRNLVYLCRHYRLKEVATYWESVITLNNWQKRRFATKIVSSMFNTVSGKKLAVLGFSYKKNTSDVRFTAAIDVCKTLLAEKALLAVHDPRVSSEAIGLSFTGTDGAEKLITIEADPYMALQGAHAIVVLTEWDQFTRLDFARVYASMQRPAFVFDGHNLLDHELLREIGFTVFGIGKPPPPKPVGGGGLAGMDLDAQREALEAQKKKGRIMSGAQRPSSEVHEAALNEMEDGEIFEGDHGEPMSPARSPTSSPPKNAPTPPGVPRNNTFGALE